MNIDDLLPFYAMDAVTDAERQFVEAQLANNPALRAELVELQSGLDILPFEVQPMAPSPAAKEQLLDRIKQSATQVSTAKRETLWPRWLASWQAQWIPRGFAVASVLALLFCIWAISLLDRIQQIEGELATAHEQIQLMDSEIDAYQQIVANLNADIERLNTEVETLSIVNEGLQQELEERNTTLAFYRDPTLEHFEVAGTDLQSRAVGLFSVDVNSMQAALWVTGLDILDANQTYQLWYIGDSGVVSGGVFAVETDGQASILIDSAEIDPYNAIGISIEPTGGSETPSDQIVMLGSL